MEAIYNYEVTKKSGDIHLHWAEYLAYAFERTNGKRARAIVLYLSSERHEEKTIKEIQDYLTTKELFLEESELEKKLKTLCYSDIIEDGNSASHYKGISDDIFDQVVQTLYAYEIEEIDPKKVREKILKANRKKMGAATILVD